MKRKLLALLLALSILLSAVSVSSVQTEAAGRWKKTSKGTRYVLSNGKYAKSRWVKIKGKSYYFDKTTYMVKGWNKINGKWYYMYDSGVRAEKRWILNNYVNKSGVWIKTKIRGKIYKVKTGDDPNDARRKAKAKYVGWVQRNGTWYYYNEYGEPYKGWAEYKGKWYLLKDDGSINQGWVQYKGVWYYMDVKGSITFGWLLDNGKWYYLGKDGKMNIGWEKIDNDWYYFDGDGVMQTGWITIDGKEYFFNEKGKWQKDAVKKIIYLTFDDGPASQTNNLLYVLRKHNVKATFFVSGTYSNYADLIKTAYNDGHSIGVSTYSKDYKKIYKSDTEFWAQIQKTQNLVIRETGHGTNLMRFPGGSANTQSLFNRGIMTKLTNQANQKGYLYFDWNVDSKDNSGTNNSNGVYQNMVNGISGRNETIILCHDTKKYTVDAVDNFISWGKSKGYLFMPLTENSPRAHFTVTN